MGGGGREGDQLGSCWSPGKHHKPDLCPDGALHHFLPLKLALGVFRPRGSGSAAERRDGVVEAELAVGGARGLLPKGRFPTPNTREDLLALWAAVGVCQENLES